MRCDCRLFQRTRWGHSRPGNQVARLTARERDRWTERQNSQELESNHENGHSWQETKDKWKVARGKKPIRSRKRQLRSFLPGTVRGGDNQWPSILHPLKQSFQKEKKRQRLSLKQKLRECEASKFDFQGGFKKISRKRSITDVHQSDLITKSEKNWHKLKVYFLLIYFSL